jgi:WD40 repeat protein
MGVKTSREIAVLRAHQDSVLKVKFICEGQYFISASGDNSIILYDSTTFKVFDIL